MFFLPKLPFPHRILGSGWSLAAIFFTPQFSDFFFLKKKKKKKKKPVHAPLDIKWCAPKYEPNINDRLIVAYKYKYKKKKKKKNKQ